MNAQVRSGNGSNPGLMTNHAIRFSLLVLTLFLLSASGAAAADDYPACAGPSWFNLYYPGSVTNSCVFTGGLQTYVVPEGVTYLRIDAWGSASGSGLALEMAVTAAGGYASGTFRVTPGDRLIVLAGGFGEPGWIEVGGLKTLRAAGGYGGGGEGRDGRDGGGGGTFVFDAQHRLLVVGGGGGGDTCHPYWMPSCYRPGGAGGGLSGGMATSGDAGGGTQTAGGTGGTEPGAPPDYRGEDGAGPAVWGDDGPVPGQGGSTFCANGGGGGGGYYGGGGGCLAPGGGGSGFVAPWASDPELWPGDNNWTDGFVWFTPMQGPPTSKSDTTTSLHSSTTPIAAGSPVTFTATVTSAGGTPTGVVQFADGGTVFGTESLVDGTAVHTTTALATGARVITATYLGDDDFEGSTSDALSQEVKPATGNSTITVLTVTPSPSMPGAPVTLTASVSGALKKPAGTVRFNDADALLGTASLDNRGKASLVVFFDNGGTHPLIATYLGSTAADPSTSAVVNHGVAGIGLTSSLSPSRVNESVTFTATIARLPGLDSPTGTVTFLDGSETLGVVPVSNASAVFSTSTLTVGSHSITASYSGDGNYSPITSSVLNQVVTGKKK